MKLNKVCNQKVHDPATLKLLGTVPDCDVTDVDIAVDSAKNAFNIWSNYTAEVNIKQIKIVINAFNEN
jgi:acyl-CoA reductase-like NAD-dependent aldehyde dehydrogenase